MASYVLGSAVIGIDQSIISVSENDSVLFLMPAYA